MNKSDLFAFIISLLTTANGASIRNLQEYDTPSPACSLIRGKDARAIGEFCSSTWNTHLQLTAVLNEAEKETCTITGIHFCNVPFVVSPPFESSEIPLEEIEEYMCAFDDKSGNISGTVETKCVDQDVLEEEFKIEFECRTNTDDQNASFQYQLSEEDWKMKPYGQADIERTKANLVHFYDYVLVFDGPSGNFHVFNLDKGICDRCIAASITVGYLKKYFPERFSPGQPSFQVHFRPQSVHTECNNFPESCDAENFSPILTYASVLKDSSLLPSQIALPHEHFLKCIPYVTSGYNCTFDYTTQKVHTAHRRLWSQLKPQVVWRGSDFTTVEYLDSAGEQTPPKLQGNVSADCQSAINDLVNSMDTLSPRWKCVTMSIQAEAEALLGEAWIDCKFNGQTRGNEYDVCDNFSAVGQPYMGLTDTSKYRYHLDLGGISGTSWKATIQKLAMPGLLFHHETPMKEWFYDDLKPWVHYVPVKLDLSDLKEKFDWAEANPEKAESIARAATEFYHHLMSQDYVNSVYEDVIGSALNRTIAAYVPEPGETAESIFKRYKAKFKKTNQVAVCSGSMGCRFYNGREANPDGWA